MSRLTDLIRQARAVDAQLGDDLEREFRVLTKRRSFGLVFEQHQPEAVELPSAQVRVGDKVRVLPPRGEVKKADLRLWAVTSIRKVDGGRQAVLKEIGNEPSEIRTDSVEDLIVVAEFRDVIYPGLSETGRVEVDGDKPFHTVINGENYHVMEMLTYTHRDRVDAIYIDPPYNTGSDDWIYNDRYVDGDDDYRPSKWLAFMQRRLEIARELLKDTGVIIVAIGDDQHHRLRMLMDQVFSERNFISDVVWQGGRKNDSRYVSNGADYMLIYAKSEITLREHGIRWRESKPGALGALAMAKNLWKKHGGDNDLATKEWRAWLKEQKALGVLDAVTRFNSLDDQGRPMRADGNLRSPNPRPNLQYDLLHPITGKPVKMHPNGWRYSKGVMDSLVKQGRIKFGPDETSGAGGIYFLEDQMEQVAEAVFERDRNASGTRLTNILGGKRFPNPKDHEVLMRWLDLVSPRDAVILDFFAGSGSTAEAVMRLNAQDGGARQCILVTNNEVSKKDAVKMVKEGLRKGDPQWEQHGVCEYVTIPRLRTITTGKRPDGSDYDDRVDSNVAFFNLTYEGPYAVAHHRAFKKIAPMLWLRAGARGPIISEIDNKGWAVSDTYGVLENLDYSGSFVSAVKENEGIKIVLVVTDDDIAFQMVCRELPARVNPVRLYESYLQNFEINSGRYA